MSWDFNCMPKLQKQNIISLGKSRENEQQIER